MAEHSSGMGIGTLLGLGVAAYFVYEYYIAPQSTVATPTVVSTPQAANPNAAIQNNTKTLVAAAAAAQKLNPNGYQSTDTWNALYMSVRGIAGPAPETLFPNVDRNKMYSLDEWWNAMTGAGFSGMGNIAHHVNPYANTEGIGFGLGLQPTGMETYIKQVG